MSLAWQQSSLLLLLRIFDTSVASHYANWWESCFFFRDCRSGSPKYLSFDFKLPSPDSFFDESLFESADIGSSHFSFSITYFSRFSCSQGSLPIWWQLTWWLWGLPFNEVWVKSGAHSITNRITFKKIFRLEVVSRICTWFIELFDAWNYWIHV